jgi:beta-galactosidase
MQTRVLDKEDSIHAPLKALKNRERVNVNVNDIVPRELISRDIDLGQMGVGGDDSWGKRTLMKYSFTKNNYSYGFTLRPFGAR